VETAWVAAVVVGMIIFFRIAARVIGRAGGGPVDAAAAARRRALYVSIVLVIAVMFPVFIYDHFRIPRWLFGG
jgi:hypothetical protein